MENSMNKSIFYLNWKNAIDSMNR